MLQNVQMLSYNTPLAKQIEHTRDKIALLPQRIRAGKKAVRDDF